MSGNVGDIPDGPWERSFENGRWIIQHDAVVGKKALAVTAGFYPENERLAQMLTMAPDTLDALSASVGYMMNAMIDLETGRSKAAAIQTLQGGIKKAQAAIAKARAS